MPPPTSPVVAISSHCRTEDPNAGSAVSWGGFEQRRDYQDRWELISHISYASRASSPLISRRHSLPRWLKQLSHASTPRLAYSVYAAEAKEVVHDRPGPSAADNMWLKYLLKSDSQRGTKSMRSSRWVRLVGRWRTRCRVIPALAPSPRSAPSPILDGSS